MSAKPTKRNWNDVQTAIATAAIVTTLGMWNLFAGSAKAATAETQEPTVPPTDPPTDAALPYTTPTAMPYVKVMFTPNAPLPTTVSPQTQQQQQAPKKKKHKSNGGGGGGGSTPPIVHTKSS